jgi:hypothetical protein
MVIRRVSPLSVAKVAALLYAALGLFVGALMSLIAMAVGSAAWRDEPHGALFGMMFGAGAIVILPILYGVFGGIIAAISAAIYNVTAHITGGVEIEVDAA